MKCEIIRDLLPVYVDGLTGAESNHEIDAHLADCAACRKALADMQAELQTPPPELPETEQRKIRPFRKLNRRIRWMLLAVVVCCGAVFGGCWKLFVTGWGVRQAEVEMEAWQDGDRLRLSFALQSGRTIVLAGISDPETTSIDLRQCIDLDRENETNCVIYDLPLVWQDGTQTAGTHEIQVEYADGTATYSMSELLAAG